MAIKGSLREASLADVCQLLALGQKSGCLSVTDGSRFGQIFFDAGRIGFARIINRRDRLGDLLVRDGLIAQDQLEPVLQRQAQEPDRRVGELLVASGHISTADLTRYVRMQIEEAIYHLFTWTRGNFYFEADARSEDADIRVSINPETLLLEAARRVDEWSQIEKKIPSLDLLFEIERERVIASGVELTVEQEQLLDFADGSRSVHEIADRTGLTEFEVGKALFGLIQAGFAHRVGRKAEEEPRSRDAELEERRNLGVAFYRANMLEDARREFERAVQLDGSDQVSIHHIALIRLREGQHRDAIRQLRNLLETGGPRYGPFLNLALALRLHGRAGDALLVLQEAEQLRPGRATTSLARGVTLMDLGRHEAAREAFHEYTARTRGLPPSAEWCYHNALNLAVLGELQAADEALEAALEHHADSAPLVMLAGLLAERRGDLDAADRAYRRAVEADGTLPQLHRNLGDIAYRRAAHEDALGHYLRAVELEPALGDDVLARIGNVLYKTQEPEAAVEYWQRALELNPDNAIVRSNLEIVQHGSR